TADGVVLHDESVTDFDTGPVHVSGNLLFDALASIFQINGTQAGSVPFQIFSGATKDKKTDDLLNQLKAGDKISDDDMRYLITQMMITAFLNDPIGFLKNGPPSNVPGFDGISLDPNAASNASSVAGTTASVPVATPASGTVPEPGTLVLLAGAMASIGVVRS